MPGSVGGKLASLLAPCEVAGTAGRIETALGMIDNQTLEAVVLDVNLDGEKSYAVADTLIARGVPFVFSTGYDESTLTDSYPDVLVLRKPFKQQELGKALEALLRPAGAIREK